MTFEPESLKTWLRHWQFWILEGQFVVLVALFWINLSGLAKHVRPRPASIALLGGIAAMMFVLVMAAPRTNRIFYDEQIYEATARNMSDLHLAQMCNEGAVEYGLLSCRRGEYNKEPHGYPYLLSIAYRVAGVTESAAHAVNVVCALLLVPIVFAIALTLFGDDRVALFSAFVLTLLPQQLWWSHTAAAEPSASLFAAFAVLAAIYYAKEGSWRALLLMTVATVFAVQFRMEVALVVPLAVIIALVMHARLLFTRRTLAIGAIGAAAGFSHFVHLLAVSGESWGTAGPRLSPAYLSTNLPVNGAFYFADARFPVVITLLALIGVAYRPVRATIIPSAAFALFWGIFLFFYAGSYDFGADVRFSLMSNPWIAILAGAGAAKVIALCDAYSNNTRRAALALVLLLLAQFTWYLPMIRSVGEEAWAARADVAFARNAVQRLPPNSIVLTQTPALFHVNGTSAAQMSLVSAEPWIVERLTHDFAGGIYLHWGAWCGYTDPEQRRLCERTLKGFDSQLIAEYRERDFRYALYRLKTEGTVSKAAEE